MAWFFGAVCNVAGARHEDRLPLVATRVRSISVYASATAETKRRRLAWLVQAKFRRSRRFCSALCEAVAPETVRRTRRGPYALARGLPIRLTTRRLLIKRAAAAKPGTAVHPRRSASPSRQRAPGVLPGTGDVGAAVSASCPRHCTAGERPD
jgi:hypothetical protein